MDRVLRHGRCHYLDSVTNHDAPFFGVFLGETLSWPSWLGIALIGAGAVLVAYQS